MEKLGFFVVRASRTQITLFSVKDMQVLTQMMDITGVKIIVFASVLDVTTFVTLLQRQQRMTWILDMGMRNLHGKPILHMKEKGSPLIGYMNYQTKVRILYEEVIEAVNAQLSILPAVGLRALIESICKERGVTGKNLSALIDGLSDKGVLSAKQAEILHSHRFLGNVAATQSATSKQRRNTCGSRDRRKHDENNLYIVKIVGRNCHRKTKDRALSVRCEYRIICLHTWGQAWGQVFDL